MIINQDGEILSQGDTPNNRHKWIELNSHKWECTKCDCIKHKIDEKNYYYSLNGTETISAPNCENTKIQIPTKRRRNNNERNQSKKRSRRKNKNRT